jgi:predicted Zn-dependent peptidase
VPSGTAAVPRFELETYALANGLTVVLHPDHSLPKVVIDTWFAVGSKDEPPGRSGFAHLFEHLMFMGTGRVPGDQFDLLMERGGGSNNASTGQDHTSYHSSGPPALLPTLLWLDAERLDALAEHMTDDKLDLQRDIVRNERRQGTENTPYGKVELLLPAALYPPGHPYHHPVIGSHEDLQAATLADVLAFFHEHYVPANATLVVAGDFQPSEAKPLIERTFGALAARPSPAHRRAAPVVLEHEERRLETDRVEFPKLYLAWHSPPAYSRADAELQLLGAILAEGPASRLEQRLVFERRLAQEVDATQSPAELGSVFLIEALAAPGANLEEIKAEILAVLAELARDGPTEEELVRAKTRLEARFLRRMESLLARAEAIQAYRRFFGQSDGFRRDLERWTLATRTGLRDVARAVFGPGRVDLRILPEDASLARSELDERPSDLARRPYVPPTPESGVLGNGIPVALARRPGCGLFSGALVLGGGEALFSAPQAGAATLAARWLESGAAGRDAAGFAAALEGLGATLSVQAGRDELTLEFGGLAARRAETLDLLADLVLRPRLTPGDLERERALLASAIRARDDDPAVVARNAARALLFGPLDPRGRALEGTLESVTALGPEALRAALPALLHPARARFVLAGDLELPELLELLETRFGSWSSSAPPALPPREPLVEPPPGRIALVDRPDAPQTVIQILRPLAGAEGLERAALAAVDTVLGGTFTSRLNANLREEKGFTYGAQSRILQEGQQFLLSAGASVVTEHTAASLIEFRAEFERLARAGITAEELGKAVESRRMRLAETFETTASCARALAELARNGRPLEAQATDLAALDALTLEDANRCARSGLYEWPDQVVVLVGDRDAILAQLGTAGFEAPLEVRPDGSLRL